MPGQSSEALGHVKCLGFEAVYGDDLGLCVDPGAQIDPAVKHCEPLVSLNSSRCLFKLDLHRPAKLLSQLNASKQKAHKLANLDYTACKNANFYLNKSGNSCNSVSI